MKDDLIKSGTVAIVAVLIVCSVVLYGRNKDLKQEIDWLNTKIEYADQSNITVAMQERIDELKQEIQEYENKNYSLQKQIKNLELDLIVSKKEVLHYMDKWDNCEIKNGGCYGLWKKEENERKKK